MQNIHRIMTNICSENVATSCAFYCKLFDVTIQYESDWFVHLIFKNKTLELGIIDRTNALVPKDYQKNPQGFYITFVVDDVDELFKRAIKQNVVVVQKPEDMFYGQRRLLLKDPDGTLLDISAPIKDFQF